MAQRSSYGNLLRTTWTAADAKTGQRLIFLCDNDGPMAGEI